MRKVRNGLVALSVLTTLVAIGTFATAAPSDEAAAAPASAIMAAGGGAESGPDRPAGLPEEAAMVLVGTALIGLAAAVRKAA